MKLATYIHAGRERWGLVIDHPATGEQWIFNPVQVERQFDRYQANPTTGYQRYRPQFLTDGVWPDKLKDFAGLGDPGLDALSRLQQFLIRFLEQCDQHTMGQIGHPLDQVYLRAPIPRPRLLWGLVQNSPAFIRNDPDRVITNLFPQGHARPRGCVVGHGEPVVIPPDSTPWSFNVELGLIIGQGGRYIPIDKAMDHVAGYTVVIDIAGRNFFKHSIDHIDPPFDFFDGAVASWGCKKTDTMCPMGPFLVTKDEIGNVYDLTVYTRQSGWLRDRSSTAAMLLGIERTISWYSSFATLFPGDVIHMATMGVDGLESPLQQIMGPNDYIEAEIEKVGVLRCPVVLLDHQDWRNSDDPGRTVHPSPAVRDAIVHQNDEPTTPSKWSPETVPHFWRLFGNYQTAQINEGLKRRDYPRFINGPPSALAQSPAIIELPPRAKDITISPELAFVISKVTSQVPAEEAEQYLLGYIVIVGCCDHSFMETIREPATNQERNLPHVYGRWPDGFNVASQQPVMLTAQELYNRSITLTVPGLGKVESVTDEYIFWAPQIIEYISRFITLFPNDVITLGKTSAQLDLPLDHPIDANIQGQADINEVGTCMFGFSDRREARQSGQIEYRIVGGTNEHGS